ncbi:Alpha-tubulin_1 [Hexamita inflata]|uniref:Alpha-tubulin 1 n=1 Tax=Hexamita inflata TaxID=28002 RepID=A0AA86QX00_9EUKA|nr:Alpha-tubulin 1 [Hexamita inflata]CAI9974006.1 Alpha-tubulin 1 [Hexamita inflata]
MREVISVHVGQAGINLGDSIWELFCIEHDINPDGRATSDVSDGANSFFSQSPSNQYIPRTLFVDLDPSTRLTLSNLNSTQIIQSEQNASNIFARGIKLGSNLIEEVLDNVRKQAENCSDLQGFMFYRSVCGGTGSGLGSLILEQLTEYSKKVKIDVDIFPSKHQTSTVEAYNTVLSYKYMREHSDCVVAFDNEAIADICYRNLGIKARHQNINRMIAHAVSSLTASIRFGGSLIEDLQAINDNLVPYNNTKTLIGSYSPFIKQRQMEQFKSVTSVSDFALESANVMISCNTVYAKYMALSLLFGGDVVPKDIGAACYHWKTYRTIDFVDWCPTGFKIGVNTQKPKYFPNSDIATVSRTCFMLANNTAMSQVWNRIGTQFDLGFRERAFVHSFVQNGMEEGEFNSAREDLDVLEADYDEIMEECYNDGEDNE